MRDWLPIIVGYGIILAAILIARLAPQSHLGAELKRSYGVVPSGDRGYRTRRDHLRSAAVASLVTVGLALTTVGAGAIADRFPNGSHANMVVATYLFGAFLGAAVALFVMLGALWKALMWRIELPDSPEHRRAFADAIDHLVDGVASDAETRDYIDVRYQLQTVEDVRRATLRLVRQYGRDLPSHHREQIKEFTAAIRSSAG